MAESLREFGDLLTQGLKSIAARERKSLMALQDQLGNEIGFSRHAIDKWRKGNVPSTPQTVAFLARTCVHRGRMDRPWLLRFLTLADFPNKEVLTRELFPDGEGPAFQVRHNLPRRPYEQFIGRDKELADLQRFLSAHHRAGVVSLSGIAGVGKTALALETAHRFREGYAVLPVDERFEAIVWVTAKRVELLPTGVATRRPTFTDLDGLYQALAEVLDLPAITRAASQEKQEVIVASALAKHRVLLVLDNLEDVDDPVLLVFLRDLPAPSKAMVTTRHRIDVAVPIQLRAFNEAEARELIHAECQRHRLALTEEQSEKLLRRTGGLPLAIVRTIGRMAWRGSIIEAELQRLGDPRSDIHDFCFELSLILIRDRDPHRLLMALALFATDAARDALGFVAGFGKDILSRDEGLSDLEVLSLVNKDADRFSLEPLTRISAKAELDTSLAFKQAAQERWVEWYRMLAEQAKNPANYANLRIEANNLLGILEWFIEEERLADAGWFLCRFQRLLYGEGHWESLLHFADQVARWAESAGNSEMLTEILQLPIGVFRRQDAQELAEAWLERAQIVATQRGDELLQAEIWMAHGQLIQEQAIREPSFNPKEISRGIKLVNQALDILRHHSQPEKTIRALNTLGNLYLRERRFEEASRFYQKGLQMLKEYENEIQDTRNWLATLRGNLGITAGRQGRYAEACEILYEIRDDLTDQTDFAEWYAIVALYELRLGRVEQAHLLRKRADRIIEQMGLARPITEEDAKWVQFQID